MQRAAVKEPVALTLRVFGHLQHAEEIPFLEQDPSVQPGRQAARQQGRPDPQREPDGVRPVSPADQGQQPRGNCDTQGADRRLRDAAEVGDHRGRDDQDHRGNQQASDRLTHAGRVRRVEFVGYASRVPFLVVGYASRVPFLQTRASNA